MKPKKTVIKKAVKKVVEKPRYVNRRASVV